MARTYLKAAATMIAALALLLGLTSAALAVSWTDLDTETLAPYGVSASQVARVSAGFPDGSWKPWQEVTRAQFAKMAAAAFAVDPARPEKPTFSDIDPGDLFYPYVEGAYSAGLV